MEGNDRYNRAHLAQWVWKTRKHVGLKQGDLAVAVGCSRKTISRIEGGYNSDFSNKVINYLMERYCVKYPMPKKTD